MKRSVQAPSVAAKLYNSQTHSSLTCHFVREDIELWVLPIKNVKRYLHLTIHSEDNDDVRRAILKGVTGDDALFYAAEHLGDFIRSVARTALYYGNAAYELVIDPAKRSERPFFLDPITPTTVYRAFGNYFQVLPKADKGRRLFPVIVLDRNRTFVVTLPRISASRWNRIMDSLRKVEKSSLSANVTQMDGYNFDTQQRLIQRAQLSLTSPIPWVQRQSLRPKEMSEVYFAFRWLRMQRFAYALRNRVVTMINSVLTCAGRFQGFDAQIILQGLPSILDIERAEEDLISGVVGPDVVGKFTSF